MEQPVVQHPRGEDAIRLTVHIERTGETEVEQDGSRKRAATGDDDGQRNGDIDDQQRLGGDRVDDDRTSVNLLATRDGALRQWNPTDAWVMQAPQIGRSHRWQRTPERRSSCR